MKKFYLFFIATSLSLPLVAQTYWQQEVDYTMTVDMDVETYQYKGHQKLIYTNHSPDTLQKVFYHLYFQINESQYETTINWGNDKITLDKLGQFFRLFGSGSLEQAK